METPTTLLGQRMALEARYDGPVPRRQSHATAPELLLRPVVAAMARRRQRVDALGAQRDTVLARMSRYLSDVVISARTSRPASS